VTSKAVVAITADASKFAADVQRKTDVALRHVTLDVKPIADQISEGLKRGAEDGADAFRDIDDEFDRAMAEITRSADEHFDRVAREADEAADEFWTDFDGAGEKVEDSLGEVGDKSKKEFDRVERNARTSASGIGSTFKRLAVGLAAAFAGIQIGRFFLDAAQSAEDLGSAIANTQQIIKSTHSAAGLLATDIREISRQLSLKIGVDSVEVQNAANILLTFKGVSKAVFPQAIGLAADLSAVLGSDLAGATLQLGKALNDPVKGVGALSRAGVQFSPVQKEQIKNFVESNNLLAAQAIILKEVKSQVGGVAIAGADTTDKLKVAFQDLKREAGEALIGFIDSSGPQMIGILQKLGPVVGRIGGAIADGLTAVLPIVDVLVTNFRDNFAALSPAIQPFADILQSVLALLPKLVPIFVQIGQTLLPPLADIIAVVAAALVPVIDLVVKLAAAILTALTPVLAPVGELLSTFAGIIGDALLRVLPPLAALILKVVEAALPLVPIIVELLAALFPLAEPLVQVALALVPLIEGLLPLIALLPVVVQLVAVVSQLLQPLIQLAAVLLSFLASKAIVPLITLIAKGLALALAPVAKLAEWLGKLADLIADIDWGKVGKAIGDAFVTAWHAVTEFFVGLGRWFSELPGKVGEFLAALPAALGNALLAAFDFALKAIGIGIGLIIAAIIGIPVLIIKALFALPGLLADFFSFVWAGIVASFHAGIDLVIFALTELPGKALAALLRFNAFMREVFIDGMRAAGRAIAAGISAIVGFVLSLPTRVTELGPKMLAAGKALIKGFFAGLSAVGGFLADVAGAVLRGLKAGLNHVIEGINSGLAAVDDVLPFSLPRIPTLARGGLTQDGGLAILHPRELVLPLEDRRAVDLLGAALAEADAGLRATGVKPTQDTGDINIRIFLGNREITDIVNVQIDERNRDLKRRVTAGAGRSA
jgi:hypothetical protein